MRRVVIKHKQPKRTVKWEDPGIIYSPVVSGDTIETPDGLDLQTPDGDTIEVP